MVVAPAANAAADPPDDPPGVISSRQGFLVTPHIFEWVVNNQQNSGQVVRANRFAPAFNRRSICGAVLWETCSLFKREPLVLRFPVISTASFTANGTPRR